VNNDGIKSNILEFYAEELIDKRQDKATNKKTNNSTNDSDHDFLLATLRQ